LKVAFYFDENVQRAITAGLRLRGVDEDGTLAGEPPVAAPVDGRIAVGR